LWTKLVHPLEAQQLVVFGGCLHPTHSPLS
jgi:hypothetical protein